MSSWWPASAGGVYGSILPTAYSSPLKIGHLKKEAKDRLPTIPCSGVSTRWLGFREYRTPPKVNIDIKKIDTLDVSPGPQEDDGLHVYIVRDSYKSLHWRHCCWEGFSPSIRYPKWWSGTWCLPEKNVIILGIKRLNFNGSISKMRGNITSIKILDSTVFFQRIKKSS